MCVRLSREEGKFSFLAPSCSAESRHVRAAEQRAGKHISSHSCIALNSRENERRTSKIGERGREEGSEGVREGGSE